MRQFFPARNLLLALALPWLATAAAQAQFAVTALSPARNATAAPRPTNVGITFNQSVNAARAGNVRVFSAQRGGQLVRGGNATASGSTITVNPASDLQPGETVFVTVPATVASTGATAATPHVYQFTATAGTATGTFDGGTDPYVNVSPMSVVVGDIDGDGDLDLLTANLIGSVNIRLNNGMGVFSGNTGVAVGTTTASVALGDLDGDGDLDLVTADYSSNTASVRLNNGTGQFNNGSNPGVGTNPTSVAVGDVDGDGDLDLLTANYGTTGTVSVRLNNGAGVFSGGSDPGVDSRPQSVAVGDVDGDGDLDLLTANGIGTVSVRLNNGAGVFSGGSNPGVGTNPTSVAVGDVDGDGDLDLLTANYG
ncbi:methionine-rich copper-binding protein CopC, partial [Hymenobacter sp. UYAg731]